MFHKDANKLRGIKPSLALDIVRTPTFRQAGCTDETARKVLERMKISRKREISKSGSTTGNAQLGYPSYPGIIKLSIYTGEHPAKVAAVFLHEMLHGVLGLKHGAMFDHFLSKTAEELWNVKIPRSGWTHVYESDHALQNALMKSGKFDNIIPASSIDPRCQAVKETFYKKEKTTEKYEFSKKDKVKFSNKGVTYTGFISRINKKRYTVLTDTGQKWYVGGHSLTLIE